MLQLTIKQISQFVEGKLNSAIFEELLINEVSTDSRKLAANTLFVPLKGEKVDGHDYLQQVAASGGCVLCARPDVVMFRLLQSPEATEKQPQKKLFFRPLVKSFMF